MPWFLPHDDQIERYRIEVDEYLRRSEENLAEWEEIKRALDAGEDLEVERNDELASQFIRALETGAEAELYGNVRNDGLDRGSARRRLRRGAGAWSDANGVEPTRIGAIPPQCLALNRTFLNVVELTVRAVVEGSRELVYQAALVDPNTAATLTVEAIVEMVDELIDAHGDLIPEPIAAAAEAPSRPSRRRPRAVSSPSIAAGASSSVISSSTASSATDLRERDPARAWSCRPRRPPIGRVRSSSGWCGPRSRGGW